MSTVALMWEARAAAGRGNELLEWARSQVLEREPVRRELLRAPQERVLVVTWWEAAEGVAAELPELPEPAPDLITRPVHRWRFESVETSGT
ncbi:hypothetical protein EDE04_2815 [Streptomyces sp. 2132.2]|uniref:ABM domain-containing protein n=1 Tax=Streptomyces vinaceus TaxID=1960 RepID=A0A5J6JEP2_STRVI|nr:MULTISPECIES: hypothetical protein [Streptomyces]QEV45998.1 hypothetical protein CP980_13620 [Streptomyces vinaceus]ROQ96356.1 hypothetical protein EDE04_2815 [Streptomyces sp. 2132.2]